MSGPTVLGGIAVAPESPYGTPGTYVQLHAISSSLGPRGSLIEPNRLAAGAAGYGLTAPLPEYAPGYVDGDIVIGLTRELDIIADLLKAFSTVTALTASFGANSAPTTNSLGVRVCYGPASAGLAYEFKGCKPTAMRFDFPRDSFATLTVSLIGQSVTKTTDSPTQPSNEYLVPPSDYASCSLGGTAIGHKGVVLTVEQAHSGADRAVVGASAIREPKIVGPYIINGAVNVELDDESGYDSVDVLDDFISQTALGQILLGSSFITLENAQMIGDPPSLAAGLPDFPINFRTSKLNFAMVDTMP